MSKDYNPIDEIDVTAILDRYDLLDADHQFRFNDDGTFTVVIDGEVETFHGSDSEPNKNQMLVGLYLHLVEKGVSKELSYDLANDYFSGWAVPEPGDFEEGDMEFPL